MNLDDSADEADAVMATHPLAHLPLALLTTADPAESQGLRYAFEEQKKLAASSERSIMRAVHGEHSQFLNDPVTIASILDMIGTIVDEGRAKAAAGGERPTQGKGAGALK
jgi:hypothetical protein